MRTEIFLKERVLYVSNDEILSYKKGRLIYRKPKEKITQRCRLGGMINKFCLIERMTRREPRCAARVDDYHFVISFNGAIINYDVERNAIYEEHRFNKGMNNPLEFLVVKGEKKNDIYYGEYIWNENKGPVTIYKRGENEWIRVYEFPKDSILHIHGIVHDEYRKGFIILTGDSDEESGIWFSDYHFSNVYPIAMGNQQYRACVAFPTDKGIYYATDTPLENNHLYFMALDGNCKIKDVRVEYHMPGPCIYGARHGEEFYFSTSVEPDSSLAMLRYRMTYKLGKGVKDRFSHVIKRDRNGEYSDIYQVKKDIMPIWLFQFGNILYPKNETNELYVILQSSRLGHGVTYQLQSE